MRFKRPSDFIIEEWARQKKMTIEDFIKWIESRPGWKKVKRYWKILDKP
tara:strand:- start:38 stop:184 length:147 start_codon:yes stop_codon:yes gene_type:complete